MQSTEEIVFSEYKLGDLHLKNRFVMAPMTRSRAIGNIPNSLMAKYYEQRTEAGMIITEGTSPSPNGLGYPRIPGLFNSAQVEGWKLVTNAVHAKGTKIFVQLMHTGRVSHPDNMPAGSKVLAPSPIGISGEMWTDSKGKQSYPTPKEMTLEEIHSTIEEYVRSAKLAIEAGFDGVELHGANGYLLEQFLNATSNHRKDNYGNSSENRNRFVLEVAKKVSEAIGSKKVGIRLSPYGVFNDISPFEGIDEQYSILAKELNKIGIAYIHTVDHSSMGAPKVSENVIKEIRTNFHGTMILSGGYNFERANQDLTSKKGELVAFGRAFLANPNLISKFKSGEALKQPDPNTFYSADEKGYTDY